MDKIFKSTKKLKIEVFLTIFVKTSSLTAGKVPILGKNWELSESICISIVKKSKL